MVWGNNEMDYGLKEWWDRLWFEGIMRWTMVWRKNEMDYGLKENEWNYEGEVMLIDDVMTELQINSRTERWSKS